MSKTYDAEAMYRIRHIDEVKSDILDPIDYGYAGRRAIDITVDQPEYTSVCPMTGLPDVGSITIHYRPDKKIIELKSLKYYLLQYRNVGIFYEHLVNRILDDLVSVLNPTQMTVIGRFTPRGGITSEVTAAYNRDTAAS